MDRAAQDYDWLDLYKNPETEVAWENDVRRALPNEVYRSIPGEAEFSLFLEPRIGAPNPGGERGDAVKAAVTAGEQRVAEAKAREAEARADEAAARAQIAVSRAQAEARRQEIAGYGSARAYNEAKAIGRGINPYQPSYGGAPIAPTPGGRGGTRAAGRDRLRALASDDALAEPAQHRLQALEGLEGWDRSELDQR